MVFFIKRFTSFRLGIWKEKRVTYTGSDCFMQKWLFCLKSLFGAYAPHCGTDSLPPDE